MRRDWFLVAVFGFLGSIEAFARVDSSSQVVVALVFGIVPALGLLWRRVHPLRSVVAGFGALGFVSVLVAFGADDSLLLYASAYLLLLPYSLLRWGSGREAAIGLAFVAFTHGLTESVGFTGIGDFVMGAALYLISAALGVAVRYWTTSRIAEVDKAKLRERERLARELHDTVAHHVTAIAIQAEAGLAQAETGRTQGAVEALHAITDAASSTLTEMRTIVGILRTSAEPDLAPQPGVLDIEAIRDTTSGSLIINVELNGSLDDLTPHVDATIYRLAQEAITNAVRHARYATRVDVTVTGTAHDVSVTVIDDGRPQTDASSATSFGLIGMAERVGLLGGTFEAGSEDGAGWSIRAVLPKGVSDR